MKREPVHGGKPVPVDTEVECSFGERESRTARSPQGVTSRTLLQV